MSDALLGLVFAVGVVVSLGASWVLVERLERVGARLGLSEALLGMLAALAADAPEITAAVTALVRNDQRVGAGVVLGSNVFNLAALLGLSAVVAGHIALHRRVVELGGAVAMWIAVVCLVVVVGVLSPLAGLFLAIAALGPYLVILGVNHERLARVAAALGMDAVAGGCRQRGGGRARGGDTSEPRRRSRCRHGGWRVAVVVGASIAMERTGAELGVRHAVPEIVVGGLVLAAVTSLPNAVAAVYLAARERGTAVLSTALNSNALNVTAGLLLPTAILGLGQPSGQTTFVAASYLALTAFVLVAAYAGRGLRRPVGLVIIAAYMAFAAILVATAS